MAIVVHVLILLKGVLNLYSASYCYGQIPKWRQVPGNNNWIWYGMDLDGDCDVCVVGKM